MRVARFRESGSTLVQARYGLVDGEQVHLISASTLADVIAIHADGALGERASADQAWPLSDVELLAPTAPLVRNVMCVGWNYPEHYEEGRRTDPSREVELPKRPTFFSKATHSVTDPFAPIASHSAVTQTLDWEVELAVVIGRGGSDIPEELATDHIFGYMVANDVSARELQAQHGGQWFKGKSLDRTCPLGPWIVTADQLDTQTLEIECRVNGELRQKASLGEMHFSIPRIIAELSQGMSLITGDVILTGTPPGVGKSMVPPQYLRGGDVILSSIESVGTLRNEVIG